MIYLYIVYTSCIRNLLILLQYINVLILYNILTVLKVERGVFLSIRNDKDLNANHVPSSISSLPLTTEQINYYIFFKLINDIRMCMYLFIYCNFDCTLKKSGCCSVLLQVTSGSLNGWCYI